MKVDITDVSPVKKTLEIEVEPAEVKAETKRVVDRYARQARIPGFRAGKAPRSVIEARYGKDIKDDVRDGLISRSYGEATREHGYRPLGEPTLEDVDEADDGTVRFKTTFEILPAFDVQGYKEVEARRVVTPVQDDDVDQAIEEIRQSRASLVAAEGRAAATGDYVVADIAGAPADGEPFEREAMILEVGATDNLPQFNEGIEGAKAGDELSFDVDYPEEFPADALKGKTVAYKLQVHEVKVRQAPELDDEFAKDLGEFENLAELEARVRTDLEARAEAQADSEVRKSILDKILLENAVPLPDVLVEQEIRNRLEDVARQMIMQGMNPSEAEFDWKKMREAQEEGARKAVHARLVLDAVAEAESIEVGSKDVDDRIRQEAARMGEKFDEVKSRLKSQGGLEAVRNQLLRERSLDFVTSVANIREEE